MIAEEKRNKNANILRAGLDTIDLIYPIRQRTQAKWDLTAAHILQTDINDESEVNNVYEFSEAQRDRLIAHARQDAAHAVIGVSDAFQEARNARIMSAISMWLNAIMLVILIFVLLL